MTATHAERDEVRLVGMSLLASKLALGYVCILTRVAVLHFLASGMPAGHAGPPAMRGRCMSRPHKATRMWRVSRQQRRGGMSRNP